MKSINEIVLFLDQKISKNKGGYLQGGVSVVIPTDRAILRGTFFTESWESAESHLRHSWESQIQWIFSIFEKL